MRSLPLSFLSGHFKVLFKGKDDDDVSASFCDFLDSAEVLLHSFSRGSKVIVFPNLKQTQSEKIQSFVHELLSYQTPAGRESEELEELLLVPFLLPALRQRSEVSPHVVHGNEWGSVDGEEHLRNRRVHEVHGNESRHDDER